MGEEINLPQTERDQEGNQDLETSSAYCAKLWGGKQEDREGGHEVQG